MSDNGVWAERLRGLDGTSLAYRYRQHSLRSKIKKIKKIQGLENQYETRNAVYTVTIANKEKGNQGKHIVSNGILLKLQWTCYLCDTSDIWVSMATLNLNHLLLFVYSV